LCPYPSPHKVQTKTNKKEVEKKKHKRQSGTNCEGEQEKSKPSFYTLFTPPPLKKKTQNWKRKSNIHT